jgi:AcrR family transcriptional regulator
MVKVAAGRTSPRDKLLAAASELFYDEGVHTVGIDRVIERAGVAKGSLYNAFGSKDELIRAYLMARHEHTMERMTHELATRFDNARDRLVGVFDIQALSFTEPGFKGCAFVSASAESTPGGVVEAAADEYRRWVRALFVDLAREAGATDPDALAQRLVMLYDGAGISAWMDHDPTVATASRSMAEMLVDAAIPRPSSRRAKPTGQQTTPTTTTKPKARRRSPSASAGRTHGR